MLWKIFLVLTVSSVASFAITKFLIPLLRKKGLLDEPNRRSSHTIPTPRGGGLGILCGILFGYFVAFALGIHLVSINLFAATAIIALIGFLDDRTKGLSVVVRFAFQIVAAILVTLETGPIERLPLPEPLGIPLSVFSWPLAIVWIVGITNIYNFLDGIDGFAALQGVIAGLGLFLVARSSAPGVLGLAIAGGCAGFMVHNWHPARVFMGDAGSGTLGFLIAALPLYMPMEIRSNAVFATALCLWFFLSDGVFTIIRRLLNHEKVWAAHRSHLYQRLVISGLRHDQVALRVLGIGSILAALAILSVRASAAVAQWCALAMAVTLFLVYLRWTSMRERSGAIQL